MWCCERLLAAPGLRRALLLGLVLGVALLPGPSAVRAVHLPDAGAPVGVELLRRVRAPAAAARGRRRRRGVPGDAAARRRAVPAGAGADRGIGSQRIPSSPGNRAPGQRHPVRDRAGDSHAHRRGALRHRSGDHCGSGCRERHPPSRGALLLDRGYPVPRSQPRRRYPARAALPANAAGSVVPRAAALPVGHRILRLRLDQPRHRRAGARRLAAARLRGRRRARACASGSARSRRSSGGSPAAVLAGGVLAARQPAARPIAQLAIVGMLALGPVLVPHLPRHAFRRRRFRLARARRSSSTACANA